MIPYVFLPLLILLVDLPWLMFTNSKVQSMIYSIQHSKLQLRILPSLVVYIALAYLATLPKNSKDAFLLGLCTYAVYDFTNLATLKQYTLQFALMDSIWGGVLFMIVFNIIKLIK